MATDNLLDAKVRALLHEAQSEDETIAHHTFAQRAESYYQKRPHLISLLREIHSAYLSLLVSSNRHQDGHHHSHTHKLFLPVDTDDDTTLSTSPSSSINGGEGSSLSTISSSSTFSRYFSGTNTWPQLPPPPPYHEGTDSTLGYHEEEGSRNDNHARLIIDALVADVLMKGVECEIVSHELSLSQTRAESSNRRCELQGSLLEVLESERVVLSRDNARLRWKAEVLVEEREALREESAFLRRRVAELAGNLTRVSREERRATVALKRRIEDLQRQIPRQLLSRNPNGYIA